ncbi:MULTISPECIES: metal ABC transporter ATP-binding protein [unclassified Enterococcus]|uniref:metal ABC transporter ATP-binding protein n=1 Tax=unclassified Enterococcus TaxID=2608891 RepID=UPI0015555CF3|nr:MULTISPECIES: metal ABC transporter ATP-binding protein [unclassified Enterococcus]MBS7577126.1 metal ABC transporter ATP-binding protein [Enterococcus sp. MMGLQ5-2]MBS7584427.1 metal ABC transporter ATP-binding protein [Enterococcus sp. MMGLQ5-1]NPD12282.1 metal ABC transporter ATP-binding protein [Enterococcus sp. MMGLQ5-1]NPD36960.1 metal ABC transporter ATP-binding protein [Enterococcus sp. MMGLQ5-2]
MLSVNQLTVSYGQVPVFNDLTVNFNSGKITGIIGPNGAGKSTLIKAILGLVKSTSGEVSYQKQPLKKIQKHIAYVEQRKDLDLSFPIDVFDLVLTGTYGKLGLFKSPDKNAVNSCQRAIEQVGLTEFSHRQIGNLSGGQLQRAFVARAIVQKAEVIVLDEPFVGIDLQSETAIMAIMKQWKLENKTIIVVHHDLNKVSSYFDDLVIMNHGLIDFGPTQQVYNAKNIGQAFSADLSSVLFNQKEADNREFTH